MTDELREFTGANASQIAAEIEDRKQREIDAWEREMEARSEQELSSAEVTAELAAEANPTPVVWGKQKTVAQMMDTLTYKNYKHNRDISPHLKPSQFYCLYGKELVDQMEQTYQTGKITWDSITDVEVEDIKGYDYPDFVDAYISRCLVHGEEATDEQLDIINDSDLRGEIVNDYVFGGW